MVLDTWPIIGQSSLVDELKEILERDQGYGAMITGEQGVGKTTLARSTLAQLDSPVEIIHIRGTRAGAGRPYSALNFLLSRVDRTVAEHPLRLFSALQNLVLSMGLGRPVIFLLDNAQYLDPMSASMIAQLARADVGKVLAVSDCFRNTPEELSVLWKDGCLTRVDVPPLDLEQVSTLLGEVLAGPVAGTATHALWTATNGNPQYLRAMLQEQVDAAGFVRAGGAWVLADQQLVYGPKLFDTVMTRFRHFPQESLHVIELLSLTGRLPLSTLLALTDEAAVTELQNADVVVPDPAVASAVCLRDSTAREALRAGMPRGRKRELLETTLDYVSATSGHGALGQMEYVSWRLDCGTSVPAAQLLSAAQQATGSSEPELALKFLGHIPAEHHTADVLTETAYAHILAGHSDTGLALLDHAGEVVGSLVDWARIQLFRATVLQRNADRHTEIPALLEAVLERLSSSSGGTVEGGEDHAAMATLADIRFAVFDGRFVDVSKLSLPLQPLCPGSSWRLQAAAFQAEADAVLGRQEDGLERLKVLDARFAASGIRQTAREDIQAALFSCNILAGRWEDCAVMVQEWRRGPSLSHRYHGLAADFAAGMMQAISGRSGAALESLLPVLSQLRTPDSLHFRGRAEAAAAYAYALLGQPERAQQHLDYVADSGIRMAWDEEQVCTYLLHMARGSAGYGDAAGELLKAADQNRSMGTHALELLLLTGAVLQGCTEQAARLEELAQGQQGILASTVALYARAVSESEPGELIRAAEAALKMDFAPLAINAAAQALQQCGPGTDQAMIRGAEVVMARARLMVTGDTGTTNISATLTESERKIAFMAAKGASSKDIASVLNLSARTVEGHLSRTYSKLNVSGRSQLRSALG